jgi:hypothetical protein
VWKEGEGGDIEAHQLPRLFMPAQKTKLTIHVKMIANDYTVHKIKGRVKNTLHIQQILICHSTQGPNTES